VLDENVLIETREGRVAILTLNRPDSLNALNPLLMRRLAEQVRTVADDDAIGCVILTGAGRGFCSGGDVRAISKAANDRVAETAPLPISTEARARWLRRNAEASRILHEMPKPTIAMINGACAGAGLSLAAACDFRFAADSAKFRPAFTSNGMPGDYGGSWLWTRILGPSKTRQLYLFDEKRDAAAALEFGLIDRVYPEISLRQEVLVLAHQLADLPGAGVAYAKANLNAAMTEGLSASLDRESLAMMLARNVLVESRKRSEA
jgi:2-(1,2-epoxy-1,2-dihydrophenyl)acetyl-CoA isomerase